MATISVILATRNRPQLFAEALRSVVNQSVRPLEIIVVNDGSDESHLQDYARCLAASGELIRSYQLIRRPKGHGQGYALNFGVEHAKGDYVAFLDDDDTWTDVGHLERATKVIASTDGIVDLYLTEQAAFANGARKLEPIWIEDLGPLLRREAREPDNSGSYVVSVEDLLRCTGFCHMNTLIVRRALFERIGGMDESNRWECDRDLYLRLIDQAQLIRYAPFVVSRHNIPDPTKAANTTTRLSEIERRIYQLRVLDRVILMTDQPKIRAYAARHKGYTLKRIAEVIEQERPVESAYYARQAWGTLPTFKWTAYTVRQMLRALRAPSKPGRRPV